MVVDGGMNGGKFLRTSHAPEPQHRPLSSPKGNVGILGPVVEPLTNIAAEEFFLVQTVSRKLLYGLAALQLDRRSWFMWRLPLLRWPSRRRSWRAGR